MASKNERLKAAHTAFSERLKLLIKERGTVVALAEAAGLSNTVIHAWLAGSEPGRDKLVALADATGVSIEWLASGRGARSRGSAPDGYEAIPYFDLRSAGIYALMRPASDSILIRTDWLKSIGQPLHSLSSAAIGEGCPPAIADNDFIIFSALPIIRSFDSKESGFDRIARLANGFYLLGQGTKALVRHVSGKTIRGKTNLILTDGHGHETVVESGTPDFAVLGPVHWHAGLVSH